MGTAGYVLWGYLSGSILYARLFSKLFGKENMVEQSKDKNPGTANAFLYGGFWCGILTLICDLLKGFLPVFFFMKHIGIDSIGSLSLALCLAAPVIGHAFPVFYRFRGGKGIAVTFGCLLGLYPLWSPFAILVEFFLFFSCVVRISPHYYRTLLGYVCTLCCMTFRLEQSMVTLGFAIITGVLCIRMFLSEEEKERLEVNLLWMH